jgi:CRISPR-associated protein (TIGR03984 family)
MYKIKLTKSEIEKEKMIDKLPPLQGEYQVMATMFDEICFGELKDSKYQFENDKELNFKKIQSIRIFNKDEEYFYWRPADKEGFGQSKMLQGRRRVDTEGSDIKYIEASQILFGIRTEEERDGYVDIVEDRGFGLRVPIKWITGELGKENRLHVITRNYLDEWDNGQLSYCDHRFVSIELKETK